MTRITSFDELQEGQEIPTLAREIDTLTLVKYCGAADDYAHQHWDHLYMTGQGFPSVVGHGWLTFAYMCQSVTDWIPQEIADIRGYAVRYHRPTLPGGLLCGGSVVAKSEENGRRIVELALWAKDAEGVTIASSPMSVELHQ